MKPSPITFLNIFKFPLKEETTDIRLFSIISPMKNTRWNIAIKLSENYKKEIVEQNIVKSIMLIIFFLIVLLILYKLLLTTSRKLNKANEQINK